MTSIVFLFAFFVVLGGVGCGPPTTYCIRRAALVPIPTPPARSASLAQGPIEASISDDNVLWASPPHRWGDRNIGLYIPRVQLQGNVLLTWNNYVRLAFAWEMALHGGAVPIAPGLIEPPEETSFGIGGHVSLHFPIGDQFVLDIGCEVKPHWVTSRIAYAECEDDGFVTGEWEEKDEGAFYLLPRAWLALGADLGWSSITAGLGVRAHPTNLEATVEDHISPGGIDDEIGFEAYPFVYMGWEIHVRRIAHFTVGLTQPLRFDPVAYAPIFGLSFRLTYPSSEYQFDTVEHRRRWHERNRYL